MDREQQESSNPFAALQDLEEEPGNFVIDTEDETSSGDTVDDVTQDYEGRLEPIEIGQIEYEDIASVESPEVAIMTDEVSFGNFKISINTTKTDVADIGEEVLYPKEDRVKLSPEKLAELFDKATRARHKKYDFINLTLTDEDKLDDTYNIDMLIRRTKNVHINYDMHNVFTIVLIDPTDPDEKRIIGTKDLYTEFSEISVQEVAISNKFYHQWASEDHFVQNLKLTYAFFQSNVSEELWEKTFETYDEYPRECKGGSLFFIIMINLLLSNTEEAAVTLQERVRNFKLSNLPGEDVTRAISLLKGAIRRLVHVKRKKVGKDDDWFLEITRQVMKVMQTSSVPDFNSLFNQLDQQRTIAQVLNTTGTKQATITYDQVFSLAQQRYVQMSELGTWTGTTTKGNESAFSINGNSASTGVKYECFNCGGNHSLSDCPQPKNSDRISQNRKKFLNAKRKKSKSTKKKFSKCSGPRPEEHGRRIIDNKEHYFHHKSSRWKLVDEDKKPVANVVVNEPKSDVSKQSDSDASTVVQDHLQFANAKKAFKTTLQGMISQLE
jgi:hypothetical protein